MSFTFHKHHAMAVASIHLVETHGYRSAAIIYPSVGVQLLIFVDMSEGDVVISLTKDVEFLTSQSTDILIG